ncbi:MAG TPA: helix-hairpin-helix domain-containing protein [Gammaproteobacteria bacterium]|nr:helix-hairpin-helix domain-containing protein [Gammaproteobacteria bacterium]
MSFYHSLLAATTALALALPVFADEAPSATNSGGAEPAVQTTSQALVQQTKMNINKATVKDLVKVKGISSKMAKAAVAYRKKNGDFKSLDDLKNVKGFKKLNADQMKNIQDQLTTG